jgi:AraC-like DNA-binding protein
MDRHDVSDEVTAEHVAQLHQADLKIEHEFNCRGLTYWFDEKRQTAFCLIEAPNMQALQDMHNHAHGELPHSIIEVDENIVESFLGRIEDPAKSKKRTLNIINDPAFRTIMVTGFGRSSLNECESNQVKLVLPKYRESISNTLAEFKGRIVKQEADCLLVSFDNVSRALSCAIAVQKKFKEITKRLEDTGIKLNIGLSSGIPVMEKEDLFEDTIIFAERMCDIAKGEIIVSSEVKDLYKSENLNVFVEGEMVHSLSPSDEKFLNHLMDYTEKTWQNTNLKVDDFSKNLGLSKAHLYRKMVSLTGKSPNTFIKDYRLKRALLLLNKQIGNISEIAFESGFNSPAYFSKCFLESYGILPSSYIKQSIAIS